MTPNDILETAREQFAETTAGFCSDGELYRYIWQADQHIAKEYGCVQTTSVSTTTTGTQGYTNPVGCLYIRRLEWDNVKLKQMMDQRDEDGSDFTSYGKTTRSGQPTHYWQYGNQVYLYPIPDQDQELKWWYCQNAPKVDQAATALACPEHFHVHYPDYLLYRMYLKDQDDGRANAHLQLWNDGIRKSHEDWHRRTGEDMFYVVRNEENYPQTEWGIA